jgi:hypothetical protein
MEPSSFILDLDLLEPKERTDEDLVGQGAMGRVHKGTSVNPVNGSLASIFPFPRPNPCSATYDGQRVVVKTIHPHLASQLSTVFVREARISCQLAAHPNVITAIGYHPEKYILCLGMEIGFQRLSSGAGPVQTQLGSAEREQGRESGAGA